MLTLMGVNSSGEVEMLVLMVEMGLITVGKGVGVCVGIGFGIF